MAEYIVGFAGFKVALRYESEAVGHFLAFLFHDVHCPTPDDYEKILVISQEGSSGKYILTANGKILFQGRLGVHFAAVVYDLVIFHLLNTNRNGVAIHAGAVACQKKIIFLPGRSGSGKSTMSAWLTAHNCSYLTDELIFLPDNGSGRAIPFTRPFCIKSGGVEEMKKILPKENLHEILQDDHGAIIPHRSLNPEFSSISSPPSLILFPIFQPGSPPSMEKISGAQAATLLMECDVNARNLADHGFQQIVGIARSTPAYQVTYGSFNGLREKLDHLFDELPAAELKQSS
jgi:hypothetical protein